MSGGAGTRRTGAFTEREVQLVLLRRMADLQAPLVEEALRRLGSSRSELREANRRWNAAKPRSFGNLSVRYTCSEASSARSRGRSRGQGPLPPAARSMMRCVPQAARAACSRGTMTAYELLSRKRN